MIVTRVLSTEFNTTEIDTMRFLAEKVHLKLVTYGNSHSPLAEYNQELLRKHNLETVHLTDKKAIDVLPLTVKLLEHFSRERSDIILTTDFYLAYNSILSMIPKSKTFCYTWENILKVRKVATALRRFPRLIVPLESTKAVWSTIISPERICVIPFGIDLETFEPKYLDLSDPRILYVGRIHESKGLGFLIEALSKLPLDFEAKFVGAGNIGEFSELTRKFGLTEKVKFFGWRKRDELHSFYEWCNIFVLPSITLPYWKEQLGMALLEAMACGRVVIGSDSGSIPDVIGNSGVVVKERSANDLAEAIVEVFDSKNYAQLLAKRARSRIERDFDARTCAEKFSSLFKHAIDQSEK